MTIDQRLIVLNERIVMLERENARLRHENELLKSDPLARSRAAEILVAKLTEGELTPYSQSFDVLAKSGQRLEVKYSKVMTPGPSKTRRLNWSKV
jgi:hypothetical protein